MFNLDSYKSLLNNKAVLYGGAIIAAGSLIERRFRGGPNNNKKKNDNKNDNNDNKNNDDDDNDKINILNELNKHKYNTSRNLHNVNIDYIKSKLEYSIMHNNLNDIIDAIKLLEELICGYKILFTTDLCDNNYNIKNNLYKLNKYRIKSYYHLGSLYQDLNQIGESNYYYLKALEFCDTEDNNHHKYIKRCFDNLHANNFIF